MISQSRRRRSDAASALSALASDSAADFATSITFSHHTLFLTLWGERELDRGWE